jgi:ribosome maturation factor RimP
VQASAILDPNANGAVSPEVGSRPLSFSKGALGLGAAGERGNVEELVRPVVEAVGLSLWDVDLRKEAGRLILRVTVDREGGVDLETIAETSERVSRRLDLEGFSEGRPYSLEVSSPGLERPLREPRHFERSVGWKVRVKTGTPVQGRMVHEGALVSADAEAIVIASAGGELRVPYGDVASARTVFEWGAERE